MERVRYIYAPKEVRDEIMKVHGIPFPTMDSALRFVRSGDKSKQIRELVMATGRAIVMNRLPECETIHDANGKMTQVFSNGYTLIIDKETGSYMVRTEECDDAIIAGKVSSITSLVKLQNLIQSM